MENFKAITEFVGIFCTVIVALGSAAFTAWYLFKGKSLEQAKTAAEEWKQLAEARAAALEDLKKEFVAEQTKQQAEIATLSRKIIEQEAEIHRLEHDQEERREINLRLRGTVDELEKLMGLENKKWK